MRLIVGAAADMNVFHPLLCSQLNEKTLYTGVSIVRNIWQQNGKIDL